VAKAEIGWQADARKCELKFSADPAVFVRMFTSFMRSPPRRYIHGREQW